MYKKRLQNAAVAKNIVSRLDNNMHQIIFHRNETDNPNP